MNLQPSLANQTVSIRPLEADDFEALFQLASDPDVWAQHPNPNRFKREVFQIYFQGGLDSAGAFLVRDAITGNPIGSSRFYDYHPENASVVIGYTFFGKAFWGGWYNTALKKLMLDYAFQFVDRVFFHVGKVNRRSQIAMERLGALQVREEVIAYHGETANPNFIYEIRKTDWLERNKDS
jgi:RimJ/RimL family protein N-acetyltransferase